MNLDEQYRALMQDWDRLRAIWKQQPENRKAIQHELTALKKHLAKIRDGVSPRLPLAEGPGESTKSNDKPAQVEVASVQPGGKARNVHTPPTDQDVQRFIEALDKTHLPGRQLQGRPLEVIKLDRVPPQWIDRVSELTTSELVRALQMLKKSELNEQEIQRTLDRMDVLLHQLNNLPPETPTTKAKEL